ncbi:MAG: hypothetical protein M0004_11175 [Actinomycetota bacterium]|nr:hypothetical protein [Actinomycetota bacterium]
MAARDPKDTLRRLVNLGSAMTGITREDVEGFVRDFVSMEGERIERAEEFAEEVFARSRRTAERVGTLVHDELRRELDARGRSSGPAGEMIDRAVGLLGDLLGVRRPSPNERPGSRDVARPAGEPATSETASEAAPAAVPPPTKAAKAPAKAAKSATKAAKAPAKAAKSPAKAAKAPARTPQAASAPARPGGAAKRSAKAPAKAAKTAGKAAGAGKLGGRARPAGDKGRAS